MSKRICGLIEKSIKWVHTEDGKKERQKLREGSKQNAPTIFGLAGINAADARAEEESGLKLKDHGDRAGADICGKENALDHAMLQSIDRTSRSGGMATKGSKEDPHVMCMTGDGAGLTDAKSGVRVGHFPGTTNFLNQSSLDVTTWLFYKESSKAEDYTVLAGRLVNVLPDVRRIYETGELLTADGEPSGIFVKLVLVGDKPFIRHVCGMLSHNANAFGAPFCNCSDVTCEECDDGDTPPDATGSLYNLGMCTHTHYGNISYEELCARAHVAPWDALGKREPAYWHMQCPCCGEVRATARPATACPTLTRAAVRRPRAHRNSARILAGPPRSRSSTSTCSAWTMAPAPAACASTPTSTTLSNCADRRSCPSTTSCSISCMACTMSLTCCSTRACTNT